LESSKSKSETGESKKTKLFIPLKELPYSRYWLLEKIKACEIFAVKINGKWYVPYTEAQKLEKKTHKLKAKKKA